MSINTRVIQAEGDWLVICFEGTKPPLERRAFFLHRTLSDWLNEHSLRAVAQAVTVHRDGEIVGLNVWLEPLSIDEAISTSTQIASAGASGTANMPSPGDAARHGKYPVKIATDLAETVHQEHLEALLEHAFEIFFKDYRHAPALAVVNRGGLAVVFDRANEESHVMRVEKLGLPEDAVADLQRWKSTRTTNYFVIPLAAFR